MSDHRDELAALIQDQHMPIRSPLNADEALDIATTILARWRLANKFKCAYREHHELEEGQTTCCGFDVIPWEQRGYG